MKHVLVPLALALLCTGGFAKLLPPDDATKAKAAETAARNAWQAKVDSYQLCKVQDKVAAQYRKSAGASAPAAKAAQPAASAAPAATPVGAAPAAAGAQPAAPAGTPVAASAAPLPPCSEPQPFAYNPPEQKPLETSGAHSPAGTAASPPSVREPSAAMVPAKKP